MKFRKPFSLPREDYEGTGKRIFIGLVLGTAGLLCAILLLIWFIPTVGFSGIHPYLPYVADGFLLLTTLVVIWGSLSLVAQAYVGYELWGMGFMRGISIRVLLPLVELVGMLIGVPRATVQRSFIKVNNELVQGQAHRYKPEDVLILLPHCIQASVCKHRLTNTMTTCVRCGGCSIGRLQELQEQFGVHMAIATGGTLARRIVVAIRPKCIIAIACERDLTSGIQDTYPLPVFGIINCRPHGPCLDTTVQMERVERALALFVHVPIVASSENKENASLED